MFTLHHAPELGNPHPPGILAKLVITHQHPETLVDGYDRQGNLWAALATLPLGRVYLLPNDSGNLQNGRCARCDCHLRDGMVRGPVAFCDDCWEFSR